MRDDEAESIACPRNPRTGVQHPKIQNEEKEREKKNECHRYKRLHVEGEEEKRIMAERMCV